MAGVIDDDTVEQLRTSVRSYLADTYTFDARKRFMDQAPDFFSRDAWHEYGRMGWLAMALPDSHDGFNADPRLIGAAMEELGGALTLEPVLTSAILSARLVALAGSQMQKDKYLPLIGSGEAIFAAAYTGSPANLPHTNGIEGGRLRGEWSAMVHGDVATHFILPLADGSAVIIAGENPGLEKQPYRLIDGRGAATVSIDTRTFEALDVRHTLNQALDETATALCAEALGVMKKLNQLTTEYLKTRQQFGRTLGSNQVLQHRAVDLYILQEEVAAVTLAAQDALFQDERTRAHAVSGAMAVVAGAARRVAYDAIQLHGAIAMTHEYAVSHYFKRLMVIERLFGSRGQHLRRYSASEGWGA